MIEEARYMIMAVIVFVTGFLLISFLIPCEGCRRRRERMRKAMNNFQRTRQQHNKTED